MPALALMNPWCVSVMRSGPRRRRTRADSLFDERDLVFFRAVEVDDLTLGLRDHLARDDDEVAMLRASVPRPSTASRNMVTRSSPSLTIATDGSGMTRSSFTTAPPAPVARRSRASAMIVVVTMTLTPRLRTSSRPSGVGLVDDPRADETLVEVDDTDTRHLVSEFGEQSVGRSLEGVPVDDR